MTFDSFLCVSFYLFLRVLGKTISCLMSLVANIPLALVNLYGVQNQC